MPRSRGRPSRARLELVVGEVRELGAARPARVPVGDAGRLAGCDDELLQDLIPGVHQAPPCSRCRPDRRWLFYQAAATDLQAAHTSLLGVHAPLLHADPASRLQASAARVGRAMRSTFGGGP